LDALAIGSGRNEALIAAPVVYWADYAFSNDWWVERSLVIFDRDRWRTSSLLAFRCVEFDPRAAGLMYAGGPGLWRSADGGRNWSQALGFENLTVYAIATGPLRRTSRVQ
jgi:hypothetical protein